MHIERIVVRLREEGEEKDEEGVLRDRILTRIIDKTIIMEAIATRFWNNKHLIITSSSWLIQMEEATPPANITWHPWEWVASRHKECNFHHRSCNLSQALV